MDEKVRKRINFLKKIFNVDSKVKIDDKNIKLIYLNAVEWCCNYKPLPLISGIGPFEWDKMISSLKNIYDDNLFKGEFNYGKDTLNITDDIMLNELMLRYIQCRPNIKILTQFSSKKLNFTVNNLYGIKKLKLSSKEIECLLYQLFCLTTKFKKYDEINSFVKLLNTNTITIYVYEGNSHNIGHDTTQDIISDNFITAIHHGQLYFNNNSLSLLKDMLLERYLDQSFFKSRLLINTLKKMMFIRKLTLLEQSKVIIVGGNVLASYGLRPSRDLDVIVSDIPQSLDDSFISKTHDIFFNENSKLFFIDFFHPKVKWEQFWKEWHIEWANMFGANNILECVHNPKFHYYFCGVKFIILDAEIARRNVRYRPASITDLLMINHFLHKNIKLNPIPQKTIKMDKETITTSEEFIKTTKYWAKTKYNVSLTDSQISLIKFI